MSNQTLPGGVDALGDGFKGETRRNDIPPALFGTGAPFGGWDTFVSMNVKPSPDVITLVRKKGWAARQHQQLPGSLAAGGGTSSSRPRAHPGTHRGTDTRRARRNMGDGDVSRSSLRPATLEIKLKENSYRTAGPGRSFTRKTDLVSPAKRPKEAQGREVCDTNPSSGGKDRHSGMTSQRNHATNANGHARQGKIGHARIDAETPPQSFQSMSECPASPPKLSRAKDSKASGAHTSTNVSSSAREAAQADVPLGLSTSGHQRNKAVKVSEGKDQNPSRPRQRKEMSIAFRPHRVDTLCGCVNTVEVYDISALTHGISSSRWWSHAYSEPVFSYPS